MQKIIIYLLPQLNFIILKKHSHQYMYIYNNTLFLCLKTYNYIFFFQKFLNILELYNPYTKTNTTNIITYLNNFLFS